ncbi:MAG TPA: protein kinase [Terracidiphilus sp.]|nr:protein kinase [Terracidiphilus sp.]
MTPTQANPGSRYIIRELLGRGRWKEVYRAVVRGEFHDRALARFIEEPDATTLLGEIKILMPRAGKERLENIARLYNVFKGDDNYVYLEEELLYRPLEALAPLKVVDRFFRVARDLCSGLASLHGNGRIHRDLKLDNCGIDHSGTAKIFDLGSVTSEGGQVKGSILSRAPELFAPDAVCTKASDVWAMGAVLFALRTGGDYPFVFASEVRQRPHEGIERERFDAKVSERVKATGAEALLLARVNDEFPNGSGKLIAAMLNFEPVKRPTAADAADRWRQLLNSWSPAQPADKEDKTDIEFQDIVGYLTAVLQGATEMSSHQWEAVCNAVEKIEKNLPADKLPKLHELQQKAAEMRQAVSV